MGSTQFQPTLTIGPAWEKLLGGLSREAFCRKTGCNSESMARWARGIRPRYGTICQIAFGMGRPVAEVAALLDAIVRQGQAEPEPDVEEEAGT